MNKNPKNLINSNYHRTKVECAGLCLSFRKCFAFNWSETGKACNLIKKQDGPDEDLPNMVYVGINDVIKACQGMLL